MISDKYHIWYETERIWEKTKWLNVPMWKLPQDALVIQELICKIRPDILIETGTGHGGSSVFYASIMELLNRGNVITVDISNEKDFYQCLSINVLNRIIPLVGNSTDQEIIENISKLCKTNHNMVILDSWHSYTHVLQEMRLYNSFVSVGSYMIIEDTHVSGHPVEWEYGKGPYEAVEDFLKENDNFIIDKECEKYGMTFNPNGYLRRVK